MSMHFEIPSGDAFGKTKLPDRAFVLPTGGQVKKHEPLARIAHRISTATADKPALTRLFLTFDLNVTRHAVVRKPTNKYRHTNLLHPLATEPGELSGLDDLGAAIASAQHPAVPAKVTM